MLSTVNKAEIIRIPSTCSVSAGEHELGLLIYDLLCAVEIDERDLKLHCALKL